ncbi:hypothetical protein DFH09DRAFT_564182 [Mycena vulgaris]|nr:hypothetical protein DFH09DRAFT_564182 [Mycena vulgaris]
MFAKSAIVSLAVFAAASPVLSAPLPTTETRDLEARVSLPAGTLSSLVKSLGKGILTGGAVSGLLSLLGEGDDSSAPAARDLEARAGLGALLTKLIGAGEESLESVLKNAVIGGVATGAAVEGVNGIAGKNSKRVSIPGEVVEDAAKVAEKTIGSVIGDGAASGIGSALGGLGIGAIISKLFGYVDFQSVDYVLADQLHRSGNSTTSKRALADLTDEEVNKLLEYINVMNGGSNDVSARALPILSPVEKGIAGIVAGLAATQGAESAIEEIKSLFKREVSFNELD